MNYRIIILPLAKKDILEAAIWYKSKQKDLGTKFVKSIRNELKYIRNILFQWLIDIRIFIRVSIVPFHL